MPVPGLYAYIDPMSGSILLQVILAALISIAAFCYRPIGRLLARLRGQKVEQPAGAAEQENLHKAA
jgi:hypothetical protein